MSWNPNYYQIFSVWKLHWQYFLRLYKCKYRPFTIYWSVMCSKSVISNMTNHQCRLGCFLKMQISRLNLRNIYIFNSVTLKAVILNLGCTLESPGSLKNKAKPKNPDTSGVHPQRSCCNWLWVILSPTWTLRAFQADVTFENHCSKQYIS